MLFIFFLCTGSSPSKGSTQKGTRPLSRHAPHMRPSTSGRRTKLGRLSATRSGPRERRGSCRVESRSQVWVDDGSRVNVGGVPSRRGHGRPLRGNRRLPLFRLLCLVVGMGGGSITLFTFFLPFLLPPAF